MTRLPSDETRKALHKATGDRTIHRRRSFRDPSIFVLVSFVVSILSLAVSRTANAQQDPRDVLLTQLENRVADLERRLQLVELSASELDKDPLDSPPTQGGNGSANGGPTEVPPLSGDPTTVSAPFVVVDDSGKEIFRVDRSPATGKASLLVQDGSSQVQLGVTAEGTAIALRDGGDHQLFLVASSDGSYVAASSGNDQASLRAGGAAGSALRIRRGAGLISELGTKGLTIAGGNGSQAVLSQPEGKNMALRISAAPKQSYGAFIGLDGAGSGVVQIGDQSEILAALSSPSSGQGAISVFSQGKPLISMNNSDMGGEGVVVVRNSSGTSVAFITSNAEGGNVTTTNPGGEGIFSAGWNGEEGGACVNTKSGLWCMGKNLPLQH